MWLKALQTRDLSRVIGNASAYGKWLLEQAGGEVSSGVQVTENSALSLPYAYACINVLSQTLAHLPLELLKEGNKGSELATRHPLFDLMRFKPSNHHNAYDWRETLEGHRNGWGNAYARIERDGPYPVALPIVGPDQIEPRQLDRDKSIVYVSPATGGGYEQYPAADVLHFSGLGYDGIRGYSPIYLAREAVGLGLAIHKFGAKFFGNGITPKGVIESEHNANTLAPFVEEFKRNFGGLDQASGTPILPKGLTYKPLTINPDDAQTLETLKFNRTEICGLYRVPPQFVMDLERSTFTNASEMDLHFVKHTIIPIISNWEAELNTKLLTESERRRGYHFKFNVNGLLRGSTKERFDAYHVALQDGWISRNEVRVMEDKPVEPGLDEFLVPNNMVGENEPTASEPQSDDEPVEQPIVESVAERMASNERRNLERAGNDIEKVADFYSDYPKFIERNALPLARLIERELNCTAEKFVTDFAERHIKKQMSRDIKGVGDLTVSEAEIVQTFYEVKHDRQH